MTGGSKKPLGRRPMSVVAGSRLSVVGLLLTLTACSWQDTRTPPRSGSESGREPTVVRPKRPNAVRHEPPASSRGRYSLAQDIGPEDHEVPADITMIPDAIPVHEPPSRGGNGPEYTVFGETYRVKDKPHGYREEGGASWYGKKFHGHLTANGETYDMFAMTGAHKTLPIPSYVRVTHLENDTSVVVRINDRGPFHEGRIIDLSYAAAARLGMLEEGSAKVRVEAVMPDASATAVAQAPPAPTPTIRASMSAPPDDTPVLNANGTPAGYWQAGAFTLNANAQALYDSLMRTAIRPVSIHALLRGEQRWHRVVVGPFGSRADGEAARQQLIASGLNPQWVVTR